MSNIDRTQPEYGNPSTQSVRDNFGVAADEIDALRESFDALDEIIATGPFLPVAGGAMTGALALAADPIGALEAATRQYVDSNDGAVIALADAGDAAVRGYVDATFLPLSGGTMTGPLTISGPVLINTTAPVGTELLNVNGAFNFGGAAGTGLGGIISVGASSNPLIINRSNVPVTPFSSQEALIVSGANVAGNLATVIGIHSFGGPSQLKMVRGDGTPGAITGVAANDIIGQVTFDGYITGGVINPTAVSPGTFRASAINPWTATDLGTYFTWSSVHSASITAVEDMRLINGQLLVGATAPVGSEKLRVVGGANINALTGLAAPVNPSDAANKAYVDAHGRNLNYVIDPTLGNAVTPGTMMCLTRAGTVVNRVGPFFAFPPTVVAPSTSNTFYLINMSTNGGGAFVFGYTDSTNANSTWLIAGSVSGTTLSMGTPVQVSLSTTSTFHVVRLTDTTGVIVYNDSTAGQAITARAFTLSGNTITLGTAVVLSNSVSTGGFCLWRSSATTFLLLFADSTNTNRLSVLAGSVSGTTITGGASVLISTAFLQVNLANIAVLTATSFAIVFTDPSNSNKPSVVAGSLSGNTITLGTIVQTTATGGSGCRYATGVLDTTHFVVDCSSGNQIFPVLVSGLTVTAGAPIATAVSGTGQQQDIPNLAIIPIDATHAYEWRGAYFTLTSDTTGTISAAGFSGNGGTTGGVFLSTGLGIFNLFGTGASLVTGMFSGGIGSYSQTFGQLAATTTSVIVPLTATRAVALWQPASAAGLTIAVIEVYAPGIPAALGQIGVAMAAGNPGDTIPLAVDGTISGLSGLAQGGTAYSQGDGTIVTGVNSVQIGPALSTSSVLLRKALGGISSVTVLTP